MCYTLTMSDVINFPSLGDLDSIPDHGLVENPTSSQGNQSSGSSGSSGSRRRGNTGNPPPKRPSPKKRYCFTWNQKIGSMVPEQEWIEGRTRDLVDQFRPLCRTLVYEFEKGNQERLHVQGFFVLKTKRRITQLLKLDIFKDSGIHLEECKGNIAQNLEYCTKSPLAGTEPYLYGVPENLNYTFRLEELRPWQKKLWQILISEPDPRDIYWVYETIGNTGKSSFSKHCVCNLPDCAVLNGKASDVMNAVLTYLNTKKKFLKVVICDIPRSTIGDKGVCISYGGFENIKNGCFYSGKYEGGMVVGPNPHMVIFANCRPDPGKFSEDRVRLYEIVGNDWEERNY